MAHSIGLENTLREICEGLRSARVTDRKKNGEKLKDFLNMNAVPDLLTENTVKRRSYSWNDLFDDINDYILKETEKYETSKTFDSVTAPLCTTLLHLCVAGSNKGKAYIKCDKVTDACLLVMKDSRLKRAIGDAYLNLLYKHVLPQQYYLGFIVPTTWEEILHVCLSACTSNYSKLDDFAKLRLVLLVMKSAKNFCQFVIPLRDCLPKWKKCFLKVVSDKKVHEVVVEITTLLLETLSGECRLSLCHFIESILTPILKIYDHNLEQKKKCSLFQLLNHNVALHHPQGRHRGEEGSLADDWDIWNKQLHNILEVICLEVTALQRIRKPTEELLRQYESFYQLSAAVYFQIFTLSESVENEIESTSKRAKLSFNKNKTFNDLVDELRQNYIPWLGTALMYVKNYGYAISIEDFLSLVKVIQTLVPAGNIICWDILEELATLVLVNVGKTTSRQSECEDAICSLWNSCVRNSTANNSSHKVIHSMMRSILMLDIIDYRNANSLFKFYSEKGMPITHESVETLSILFHKFFSKYSYDDTRAKCFSWLADVTKVDIVCTKELLLRLLSNENINIEKFTYKSTQENLYETLFQSTEKFILFSEFELELNSKQYANESTKKVIEINTYMENKMRDHFKQSMIAYATAIETKDVTLNEYITFIHVVVAYMDIALQNNAYTHDFLQETDIYHLLQKSLAHIYLSVENSLNSDDQIPTKVKILEGLKGILLSDLGPVMSGLVRNCVHKRFFQSVNRILVTEATACDEEIVYAGDEKEMTLITLKHSCTVLLAAYCTKDADYRQDLLKHILDPKIYDFSIDAPCLFECFELLTNEKIHQPPTELLFTVMQYMVKDLYRDPEASSLLLRYLMKLLETVWSSEGQMKQNCHIMMRSYVTRCEKLHYPPHVAALVYECVAKTAMLNRKHNFNVDNTFENALTGKIKGNIHSLRVYCCYLLKHFVKDCRDEDTEILMSELSDIFKIEVADGQQLFLKDELRNRTLTVLHCYLALAQTKKALTHHLVMAILSMQKEKCLDNPLVKKVLNEIVNGAGISNFENYVGKNIVSILYYWFTKNYNIDDLPVFLLGCESLDEFKEKYNKWLIAADILWRKGGDVTSCDYLKQTRENRTARTEAELVETCFTEIIVLCLPYMVTEKYALGYRGVEAGPEFKKSTASAQKLFHLTGQILENMKWTDLFVENVGELVLMTASQLWDRKGTVEMLSAKIPEETKPYGYTKEVFTSILEYFGDLTGGNIMLYLCENQPLAIFQVLFSLWKAVLEESVIEFKMIALHAYLTFLKIIPRGLPTDAFVGNFTCKSLTHGIKSCRNSEELLAYSKAVKLVLESLLPNNTEVIRQSVNDLISALSEKQKENLEKDCQLKGNGEDVIDFASALPQSGRGTSCSTIQGFKDNVEDYITSFGSPSLESLTSLRKLLSENKHFLAKLCKEMSSISFSEDCKSSIVHQLVHMLSSVLKSVYHGDNIKIEACNCLSEIVTYDLKTLVTVPPMNTERIVDLGPKNYMACVVLKALSQVLFDDDPVVTGKVAETLNNLLKFREGNDALDLEQVDKQILRPLTCSSTNLSVEINVNPTSFNQYCTQNPEGIFLKALTSNWNSNDRQNHRAWLKKVTTVLLTFIDSPSSYFGDLLEVCAIKSTICRQVLPPLIGLLLFSSLEMYKDILSKQINNFFNHIWEQTFDDKIESSSDCSQINPRMTSALDVGQKMVVQYMLDVVDFVRLQKSHYKLRPERSVESLNYLRLSYDKVAWAATVADQHLAAIYYGELWAVAQNKGFPPSSPDATTSLPGGENVQQIFRKSYVAIGEMDAIDGCGTVHLTKENEKRRHLINTGQYSDSLLLHDIALSYGGQVDRDLQAGVVRSLHKSGMHHLALQYIKSLPENDGFNDIKYECLSFLGDWSEIVDTKDIEEKSQQNNCNTHSIIKAFHYACLRECLNAQITDDGNKLILPLNRAKLAISRLCQNLNMENCQSVYKVLSKLHLFSDIEEYFSVRMNKVSPTDLLIKWKVDNLPVFTDFKHMEPLISQRVSMLEHAAKTFSSLQNEIVSLQIDYAKLGLSNNRIPMSQRLLAIVKKMQTSEEVALVESEISWAKGHKEIALSLLRNIVTDDTKDVNLAAISLRQYGLWMAESKRDNTRDIINKYLLQSLKTVRNTGHVETKLKVYHDIAKLADAEYKQMVAYVNSSTFESKIKCVESMRDTATTIKATPQQLLTSHDRKAYITNERLKDLDESEIANTRADMESFLRLAIRYYMLSLKECEENNLSVFRLISLWLNNPEFEFTESDGCKFEDLLHAIPSRKFITVLPQLAPRLTMENNSYADNLRKLIKRCAMEHPHHTLPILFALKNADKDTVITNAASMVPTQGNLTQTVQEPRTLAAQEIVKQLSTETRQMALIVKQMEMICDATISLANFNPKTKESKQKIPSAEQITKLKNLDAIPIPTVTIPVKNDCKYTDFPRLNSFENYFELVGGINFPKKVTCTDSNGNRRVLLVKGKDDMRQDAVMQQVFNIVNTLLEKDPVTRRNKLHIRTYKVVPMSKQSGVLEWCVGTMPIGLYLAGVPNRQMGAHSRYRPEDMSCSMAREEFAKCAKKTNKEKLLVFNKILRELKPVFHYFFTEHYLDPVTWYERRLAYTKSVAASSMVGHIIGLGDRHVQNILIDKRTAEVIHIDFEMPCTYIPQKTDTIKEVMTGVEVDTLVVCPYVEISAYTSYIQFMYVCGDTGPDTNLDRFGIAFDQGKTLTTPETVPFRLTQDIIAGFGSSGVEGMFRGCCEKTMQLLRDNSETLLTILEVLLYDPLYSWTVKMQQNPSRNISMQGSPSSNSGLAERALLAVSSKLSGTEGGAVGGVAVPGQVARLLTAAADPANLCKLFAGWQPYL